MKVKDWLILAVPGTVLAFLLLLCISFATNGFLQKPLAAFAAGNYVRARYPDNDYQWIDAQITSSEFCEVYFRPSEGGRELVVFVRPSFFPVHASGSAVLS